MLDSRLLRDMLRNVNARTQSSLELPRVPQVSAAALAVWKDLLEVLGIAFISGGLFEEEALALSMLNALDQGHA